MKKTLFFILLLALLPFASPAMTDETFEIRGDLNIGPDETATVYVYPHNYSYTYVWNFEDSEKAEMNFTITYKDNTMMVTPRSHMTMGLLHFSCDVYDANGVLLGSASEFIVVDPQF